VSGGFPGLLHVSKLVAVEDNQSREGCGAVSGNFQPANASQAGFKVSMLDKDPPADEGPPGQHQHWAGKDQAE
jgi:hypothetical protein